MWLPGSSLFTPEHCGVTAVAAAEMHACQWKRWLLLLELLLLLHGERLLAGLPLGQLPVGSGAVLHSPAACMLREISPNLEICTYFSHRKSQQEKGGSLLHSITFQIPCFFTFGPKMSQQCHNSNTEKPVQHNARSLSFAPPLLHTYNFQRISFMSAHHSNGN